MVDPARVRDAYRNYLLVLLTTVSVFNFLDRLALGVMLQDIKADLSLSDTQLGFLTGIAFALFYAVMGVPLARWADRGNRVSIIALTIGMWGVTVAMCGVAASFWQLILVRIGVAVGEAGCQPPALSLLADHFKRGERAWAVSRYMLGWPLALLGGGVAAGWLNELYGWRTTFFILGTPGLILALAVILTLREPRVEAKRHGTWRDEVRHQDSRAVLAALWRNATYRQLVLCLSVSSFFSYGLMQWQPAFFMRSYGLGSGELGTWLGLIYGSLGFLGTFLGGEVVASHAANDERLQLRGVATLFAVLGFVTALIYLAPRYEVGFAALGLAVLVGAATNGPLFAATQTMVPPGMRAMSLALVLFFSNLIGMGFGSLMVGALSDYLQQWLGNESLRYALVACSPGYLWCAWHAYRASLTASDTAARADSEVVSDSSAMT